MLLERSLGLVRELLGHVRSSGSRRTALLPQVEGVRHRAYGIIHVPRMILGTGNEQQIRIEGGSGLKEHESSG